MTTTTKAKALAVIFICLLLDMSSEALPRIKRPKPDPAVGSYLDDYLKTARAMNPPTPVSTGSLWVSNSPMANLSKDYRALNAGDLLIIHLADNFTANTSGENKQQRQFTTSSAITGLLGQIGLKNRLQNLFNATSNTSLDGKGQSTLSSNVSLNLSAQVLEVLPNGIFVVQAARDISVGNDRQTVILRGLVRAGDLAPDNSISSNSISNLQVEIKGKGAVAEITRQPNLVIRMLLKLFTF